MMKIMITLTKKSSVAITINISLNVYISQLSHLFCRAHNDVPKGYALSYQRQTLLGFC